MSLMVFTGILVRPKPANYGWAAILAGLKERKRQPLDTPSTIFRAFVPAIFSRSRPQVVARTVAPPSNFVGVSGRGGVRNYVRTRSDPCFSTRAQSTTRDCCTFWSARHCCHGGRGSGKTRTLVGRYLWLIEQGHLARSLVAITFTEKAAREMRNRIREEIGEWRKQALPEEQKLVWDRAASELDAARIGTIHGLCASLLRSHPAEAGVDPIFEVLEENTAILLQARAVEDVLAWAIDDPVCGQLFGPLDERRLRETITSLLQRRLDAQPAFQVVGSDALQHWSDAVAVWLDAQLAEPDWQKSLQDLSEVSARNASDKLELARQDLLIDWAEVQEARTQQNWEQVITSLAAMRRSIKTTVGAKGNWSGDDLNVAKEAMRLLRQHYDEHLKPLLGSGTGAPPADWAYDMLAANLIPGLQRLFAKTLAVYEGMKADRQALDFDDLESKAATLLVEHPAVCDRWQNDISAVLVDEFQDTNARQREIIYRITGFEGNKVLDIGYSISPAAKSISNTQYPLSSLFIVGDGKQSIYRFRGADVSVFRQVQDDIRQAGGQLTDLDTTYRAHRPLLETLNALLAPILGEEDDPDRPYHTPFAPLHAHRQEPEAHTESPFLEFHLGLGNAEQGRAAAADGLAQYACTSCSNKAANGATWRCCFGRPPLLACTRMPWKRQGFPLSPSQGGDFTTARKCGTCSTP